MTPTEPGLISLVIPACNEAESLPALFAEIDAVAATLPRTLEILVVDDGSTDSTWDALRAAAAKDSRIRGLRLRTNFGKAAALNAGFQAARGTVIVTLDADLQDDPGELPRFLGALDSGHDLISGWKKIRHDPWHKVLPSRVFNAVVSAVTGVKLHDHNCGFKALRAGVLRDLRIYGDLYRFIPVLAANKGYRVSEIEIHHRPRRFGRSHYGVSRFLRGFLDLFTIRFLTRFGRRPLHAFGASSLLFFLLGFAGLLVSLNLNATRGIYLAILCTGLLVSSMTLFGVGLVAELIVERSGTAATPPDIAETTDA